MDPDVALANARQAATEIFEALDTGDVQSLDTSASNLAESFQALDEWLTSGGFLPDAWHNRGRAQDV